MAEVAIESPNEFERAIAFRAAESAVVASPRWRETSPNKYATCHWLEGNKSRRLSIEVPSSTATDDNNDDGDVFDDKAVIFRMFKRMRCAFFSIRLLDVPLSNPPQAEPPPIMSPRDAPPVLSLPEIARADATRLSARI